MPLTAAIIVPTRGRVGYLARALASLSEQAREERVEVVVVDDGPDEAARAAAPWARARGGRARGLGTGRDAGSRAHGLGRDRSRPGAGGYRRGTASRRYDVFKGRAPSARAELALLARTALHGPLRRCSNGPVMAAHSLGRLRAMAGRSAGGSVPDFLSGESGHVAGRRGELRRIADGV